MELDLPLSVGEPRNAASFISHHNGHTEGVNTRIKRITRQMHGRAGFALLRHRILLQRSPHSATTGYWTELLAWTDLAPHGRVGTTAVGRMCRWAFLLRVWGRMLHQREQDVRGRPWARSGRRSGTALER